MCDKPFDIFISFRDYDSDGNRSKASKMAENFYYSLRQLGFNPFYAPESLHGEIIERFKKRIDEALSSSKLMLLIIDDADRLWGKWVKHEWDYFNRNQKPIIRVLLDMDTAQQNAMPACLAATQWFDLSRDEGRYEYSCVLDSIEEALSPHPKSANIPAVEKTAYTSVTKTESVPPKRTEPAVAQKPFSSGAAPVQTPSDVLKYEISAGCATITAYTGNASAVKIPETVNGVKVIAIGDSAFIRCGSLKSISIPYGVARIGSSAFSGCKNLTGINLPDSITSIGSGAFFGCSSLTEITVPGGITSIGSRVFSRCSGLTEISIPESVSLIDKYAFEGCSVTVRAFNNASYYGYDSYPGVREWLFSASQPPAPCQPLPAGLKYKTVSGHSTITQYTGTASSLVIPENIDGARVIGIGFFAFKDCAALTSITIPKSVMTIDKSAFFGCSNLTEITIPCSVSTISERVFAHCKSLESINIPHSVTSIGSSAFQCCYKLIEVTIPDSVTSMGNGVFSDCSSLKTVKLSENITKINMFTFSGCTSLTEITIPDSVTSIGDDAFARCKNLESITIPESVNRIGGAAFSSCSVVVLAPNPPSYYGKSSYSGVRAWIQY